MFPHVEYETDEIAAKQVLYLAPLPPEPECLRHIQHTTQGQHFGDKQLRNGWQPTIPVIVYASPAVIMSWLYVGAYDGNLYAFVRTD